VNLGILIFLGFNFFVHGIKEMEFYIPIKEIQSVTISNGGGKGSSKDTTAVAGRTLLLMVLFLGGFESCYWWF
jgi:hypothetical protein